MASIPKKVAERFIRAVPKFQRVLQIAKDRDVNESDTVAVLAIHIALGFFVWRDAMPAPPENRLLINWFY
jgi:hypothetical protein